MDGKGAHAPNVMVDKCACPNNCGLCTNHLSHSGLANIIVTNRCDLTCWYCFFYVKKGLEGAYLYEPNHEQVRAMMKTLKAEKPIAGNSIQITGGEPMLRDDITDIIQIMKEEGVDHVQLNTNGIKLALSPETMRQVQIRELAIYIYHSMVLHPELIRKIIGRNRTPWNLQESVV